MSLDKYFDHGTMMNSWAKPTYFISVSGNSSLHVKAPTWGMLQAPGMRHYVEWYTKKYENSSIFSRPNMLLEDKIYAMSLKYNLVIRAYPLSSGEMQPGKNPYELLWGVTEDAFERDAWDIKDKRFSLLHSDCRLVSKKMLELLGLSVEEDEWGWDIIVPPELLISDEDEDD